MPKCRIDQEASPTFQKLLSRYRKSYPKLESDLDEAFKRIAEDFTTAAHANRIPRLNLQGVSVWKYRYKSSDQQKSAAGGLRIIAVYVNQTAILYPVAFYFKSDRTDISAKEIAKLVSELAQVLAS